jgi:transposase
MEDEKITMSQRQLQRFQVLQLVLVGKITLKEATEKMGVSYRQSQRLREAFKEKGARGLIHGNTGRSPTNRIREEIRQEVLRLSRQRYSQFNDIHFTEQLVQREQIILSRESVRKWRREAGMAPKRKRRPKKHYKRRERKPQEGLMVLWDGSPHRWFGPLDPPCCLMAALDDARGIILVARFFPFEGSYGYLWLLRSLVDRHGIPISIYQDCHGSLYRNDPHWTLEEQLAGRQEPTQVGLALEALGIEPIFALSPQAKGRIERLFETLQDRLGAEIQLADIHTLEAANQLLEASFIEDFNSRFSLPAKLSQKAWRPVPKGVDLNRIISFRYKATVGNDNTVRIGGLIVNIAPGPYRRSYAKAQVEVRQLLDGSWKIYYQNQLIAQHPSTTLHEPIRALKHQRTHVKGAKPYDWIYQASAPGK